MFEFPENPIPWIIIGIASILILITLFYLLNPLRSVGRYIHVGNSDDSAKLPKASVIVYSSPDEENLLEFLDQLSIQNYPDFEVIVVCDTNAETTSALSDICETRYSNVYLTFIPPGSHNLSRRKLALTLGMKAAKGEVVVTTVSNARIPSEMWLSQLLAPFVYKGIDVTLGYSHMNFSQMKGIGKWYREFISLLSDVQWIGYALDRAPYRGDGFNLAFRRRLFFEHKGYSKTIYLHSGDDDLFINEIANPGNTAMVLSPETILNVNWESASKRIWRARKDQYDFTSHWLPRAPFIKAGLASAMQWLIPLFCVAAGILGFLIWGSLIPAIMALLLIVIFFQAEILIYRKAASSMEATRLWWALPIFWLIKPLGNAMFRIRHRSARKKNFTWQRN